jgi:sugar/nucleoside kinase (ribokinase family)
VPANEEIGMHDVYAYGVIAPSTLIELSDAYPPPAGYAEIGAVHPSLGGEAAASAFTLARLGIPTKLAGARLGADEESSRVLETLATAGVEVSAISNHDPSPGAMEIILSAGDSRTVLGTYVQLNASRNWDPPSEEDVRESQIVCLDPFFGEDSLQVAHWCRAAKVPYVTVDVAPDSDIARNAEVIVISSEYTDRTVDPQEVFRTYAESCTGLVVLTRGGQNLLYGRAGESLREHAPYPVELRDTTGAGDSFRAGIIHGMLRGLDIEGTIETAAAVAAMVCRTAPGVLHAPTPDELETFLAAH